MFRRFFSIAAFTRSLLTLVVIAPLAFLSTNLGSAAEPTQLGYERWTAAPAGEPWFSGVMFGHDFDSLYGTFTNKLELFETGKGGSKPPAGHRLIDIDRVGYDAKTGKIRGDVVWIKNVDKFKANSWLLYDLTEAEVQMIALLPNAFILDIENYGGLGEPKYAIILRDNPKQFEYVVFTHATTEDTMTLPDGSVRSLHQMFDDRENWRATDIDVMTMGGEYFDWPKTYDPYMTRYDVVFTRNHGQNQKETVVLEGNDQKILDYAGYGMQLTDFEDNCWKVKHYWPSKPHLMIFVAGGQPFNIRFNLAKSEWTAELEGIDYFYDVEDRYVRCIDIETHPTGGINKDAVFLAN